MKKLILLLGAPLLLSGCGGMFHQKKGLNVHYGHICATNAVVKEVKMLPTEVKFKDFGVKPDVVRNCELHLQTDTGELYIYPAKDLNCDPKLTGNRLGIRIYNGKAVGINPAPEMFLDELKLQEQPSQ